MLITLEIESFYSTNGAEIASRLKGNVTIGGLVPVHPLDNSHGKCNYDSFEGAFGMLRLEAMIFSVNQVSPNIYSKSTTTIESSIT